ncbi:MAG: hypothetical protein OXG91_03075 [bacterium]|nr:hypothetical protein [bacterium]
MTLGVLPGRRVPEELFRNWSGPLRHNPKVRPDLPPSRPRTGNCSPGPIDTHLDEAFAEHFCGPLPDVAGAEQQFTIAASELDATSDRIIEFLAEPDDAPINAVLFRHFADGGHEHPAPTWLLDPHQVQDKAARPSRRKLRPWNGRDFYVILGRAEPGDPRRPIAHKYGSLNAGGGSWYRKPLRNLEPEHRVFAHVSGAGYVRIGRATGKVIPPRDADVEIEGRPQPLLDQPDVSAARSSDGSTEGPRPRRHVSDAPQATETEITAGDDLWTSGALARGICGSQRDARARAGRSVFRRPTKVRSA